MLLLEIKQDKSMNTENKLGSNNLHMGVTSKGKQWTSSTGQASVYLREELAWESGGRTPPFPT